MQQRQDKKARLHAIRTIVSEKALESQEELLENLADAGFQCTQTTLSRDLKQLRISKVRVRNGHSVYALPREVQYSSVVSTPAANTTRWQIQFSGNLLVLHTPPGHASMVAYDIDNLNHPFFLGTVAGDDTIIIVMAEGVGREEARRVIEKIIPKI